MKNLEVSCYGRQGRYAGRSKQGRILAGAAGVTSPGSRVKRGGEMNISTEKNFIFCAQVILNYWYK
jgi:hypothetical protein